MQRKRKSGMYDFSNGRALVIADANGKKGYIDKTGREIIPTIYERAETFSDNRAVVGLGPRGSTPPPIVIDQEGEVIVAEGTYEDIRPFSDGYAAAQLNGKWGFIDIQGHEVVSPQYDFVGDFSQGKAFVRNGAMRAIIDRNNNVLKKSENCRVIEP